MTKPGIKFKKFVIFLVASFFIFSSLSSAELAFKLIKTEHAASQPGTDEFFIYFNKKTDSLQFKSFLRKNQAKEDVLIFEFYNTNSLIPYKTLPLKKNGIIKAVTAQFESSPPVGRVFFYLQEKKNFEVSREGNLIKITLTGSGQIKNTADKAKAKTPGPALSETVPKTASETAAKTAEPAPAKTQPENQAAQPELNIEGYKTWEFSRITLSPFNNLFLAQSLFEGIRPTPAGRMFDWREKLKLGINGQVSDKISVSYDLFQDPDNPPDQYNITVNYDKHSLTFGDFTKTLSGNEFATLTKSLNGVMFNSKDTGYDLTLISARDKSYSKTDVFNGTGSRGPYKLSNNYLIEKSETVFLNNTRLERGIDYTMNYFDGEITFSRLISTEDTIEVRYEYTNFIDLFFPSTSRKEFLASRAQVNWPSYFNLGFEELSTGVTYLQETAPKAESSFLINAQENFTVGLDPDGSIDRSYQLSYFPVKTNSETIKLAGRVLARDTDYTFDWDKGQLNFSPDLEMHLGELIETSYQYYKNLSYSYSTYGSNAINSYYLPFRPVVYTSEVVRLKFAGDDFYTNLRRYDSTISEDLYRVGEIVYAINYTDGYLDFKQKNDRGQFLPYLVSSTTFISIDFRYTQYESATQTDLNNQLIGFDTTAKIKDWNFSVNAGQSSSNQIVGFAYQTDDFTGTGDKTYTLSRTPIPDSEIVTVNGNVLTREIDYIISYQSQKITFFKYAPTQLDAISVRYQYATETAGQPQKGRAFSFNSKGNFGQLGVETTLKKIDPNFYAIGANTSRGTGGSRDEVLKLNYAFDQNFKTGYGWEKYQDQIDKIDQSPVYLVTERQTYNSFWKPFNLGDLNLALIDTLTYDQMPLNYLHNYDAKRKDLKTSFSFGPENFTSLLEAVRTTSLTDFLDQTNPTNFVSYFWHGKNSWKILENLNLNTDLQRLDSKTDKPALDQTERKTVDALDLSAKYLPLTCLTTQGNFYWQRINPESPDLKVLSNKKIGYQLDYSPSENFKFNFNRENQETANIFQNQPPILSSLLNWSSTVKPWQPVTFNLLQTLRSSSEGPDKKYDTSNFLVGVSYFLSPLVEVKLQYNHQTNNSFISPTTLASFDRIYSALLNYQFSPVLTFKTGLERDYFLSQESAGPSTGTGLSLAELAGINWKIFSDLTAAANLRFEDYQFNSDPVTRTNNYFLGTDFTYSPASQFSATFSINQIFIKDLNNFLTHPSTETKTGLKIPLLKNSWLNLDYERADTTGKIKKKVIENINTLKQTISLGVEFEFPFEAKVPSSLLISAKVKRMSYADRSDSQNNFQANMILGEAKLEF